MCFLSPRGDEETLIAKLRRKYEKAQPSTTAPMLAAAPAPATATPTFGFGSTNNASAGVPGGIFPPPAASSSPFGTVTGFGAAKPPGIGGGGPVFGQVCGGYSTLG